MCHPAIPIVMSVAMSAYSMNQQRGAIEEQNEAAAEQAQLDIDAANEAAAFDRRAIIDQMNEQNEASAQESLSRQLQGLRERGRIIATQADSGTTGQSALSVLNASIAAESRDQSTIEANRNSGMQQSMRDGVAADARRRGRVNNAISTQKANSVSKSAARAQMVNSGIQGFQTGWSVGKSLSGAMPMSMGKKSTPKYKPHRSGAPKYLQR